MNQNKFSFSSNSVIKKSQKYPITNFLLYSKSAAQISCCWQWMKAPKGRKSSVKKNTAYSDRWLTINEASWIPNSDKKRRWGRKIVTKTIRWWETVGKVLDDRTNGQGPKITKMNRKCDSRLDGFGFKPPPICRSQNTNRTKKWEMRAIKING